MMEWRKSKVWKFGGFEVLVAVCKEAGDPCTLSLQGRLLQGGCFRAAVVVMLVSMSIKVSTLQAKGVLTSWR